MDWFIPTYYGDVKLMAEGPKVTRLVVQDATEQERKALAELHKVATKKKWITTSTAFGVSTEVKAPIEKVAKLLAKMLKPGKKLVSAVKFSNGKIEEVLESTFKVPSPSAIKSPPPPASAPVKATTVEKPVLGCPPPNFSLARLRAWNVLTTFLTPEQKEDFIKHDAFITVGGTTGHRYQLTSRTRPDLLAGRYKRTLYDLDDNVPLCVHNWDVPPEEELHALNILIQLPGYEGYLRELHQDDFDTILSKGRNV